MKLDLIIFVEFYRYIDADIELEMALPTEPGRPLQIFKVTPWANKNPKTQSICKPRPSHWNKIFELFLYTQKSILLYLIDISV